MGKRARDDITSPKKCTWCKKTKEASAFNVEYPKDFRRAIHLAGPCKDCLYDPLVARRKHLWYTYHLTLEQFDLMLQSQDGKCKICAGEFQTPNELLVVDHCHKTKKNRALLCDNCNTTVKNHTSAHLHRCGDYVEKEGNL